MKFLIAVLMIFSLNPTHGLKPKVLKGKFSDSATGGFVDLPMTPIQAFEMGWRRPPENLIFMKYVTFCDDINPLVCISYNRNSEILKISAIPTVQHRGYTDLRAVTHSYKRIRLFGRDVYESPVWFLDPRQMKRGNLTVPDSKYLWGPIEANMARIEPTVDGLKYTNLLRFQFCYEKMGNHYALTPLDSVLYITDPYSGELLGWEFIMSGLTGPHRTSLIDDNGSFIIHRKDNPELNEFANEAVGRLFSAFHVYFIPTPTATKCPESINAIIDAYDRRAHNDDRNNEPVYREGGLYDPALNEKKTNLPFSLNWLNKF